MVDLKLNIRPSILEKPRGPIELLADRDVNLPPAYCLPSGAVFAVIEGNVHVVKSKYVEEEQTLQGFTVRLEPKGDWRANTKLPNFADDKILERGFARITLGVTGGTFLSEQMAGGLGHTANLEPLVEALQETKVDIPIVVTVVPLGRLDSTDNFPLFMQDLAAFNYLVATNQMPGITEKQDGIVTIHGTDTAAYSGANNDFQVIFPDIPDVHLGSMESLEGVTSEAIRNLEIGFRVSISKLRGSLVAVGDHVYAGAAVYKEDPTSINASHKSLNRGQVAENRAGGELIFYLTNDERGGRFLRSSVPTDCTYIPFGALGYGRQRWVHTNPTQDVRSQIGDLLNGEGRLDIVHLMINVEGTGGIRHDIKKSLLEIISKGMHTLELLPSGEGRPVDTGIYATGVFNIPPEHKHLIHSHSQMHTPAIDTRRMVILAKAAVETWKSLSDQTQYELLEQTGALEGITIPRRDGSEVLIPNRFDYPSFAILDKMLEDLAMRKDILANYSKFHEFELGSELGGFGK